MAILTSGFTGFGDALRGVEWALVRDEWVPVYDLKTDNFIGGWTKETVKAAKAESSAKGSYTMSKSGENILLDQAQLDVHKALGITPNVLDATQFDQGPAVTVAPGSGPRWDPIKNEYTNEPKPLPAIKGAEETGNNLLLFFVLFLLMVMTKMR